MDCIPYTRWSEKYYGNREKYILVGVFDKSDFPMKFDKEGNLYSKNKGIVMTKEVITANWITQKFLNNK